MLHIRVDKYGEKFEEDKKNHVTESTKTSKSFQ